MDRCSSCGEPLGPGELCGVCLFTSGIESGPELPEMIGRYRIIRLLGEGGMGSVFEAEQEQPRRTVALKVIRSGLLTAQMLQRFERESHALARLQHPGIAQIYEAGTADYGWGAQPYFAMEFIEGVALDQYAGLHQLDTRQRLALTIQVCEAVEHAHRRGVIHRDLKPGNILVDENGQPKILDFGLARITDSDVQASRQTDMGQLIGTLAYMSPEQVLANPLAVDTRSDVYALGVILYELLAGKLPYSLSRQLHEAVRTIREQDAAPLSVVSRSYRGDIETIVAKALEKDRERRYSSPADLAADIRRHLEDQPISAKPPSTAYQLQKFARRNRAPVIGVAAVFVVLIAGVLASMREAARARAAESSALAAQQAATRDRDRALKAEIQAEQGRNAAQASEAQARLDRNVAMEEKKRADREAAIAAGVNEFLQNDLLAQASANKQSGRRNPPDPDLKVRTALDRAAERITGKFDKQPEVEAAIRSTMGESYTDLGVYPEARKQLERALELQRQVLGPENPKTINTMHVLGRTALYQGKHADAESLASGTVETSRRALGLEHPTTLTAMTGLANVYYIQGKYAQAEALYSEVLKRRRRKHGPESVDTLTMNNLASVYSAQGKYPQAEALQLETVETRRRLFGAESPATLESMNVLANNYYLQAKYKEAVALHSRVAEVRRRILGPNHLDTLYSAMNLGSAYLNDGRYKEAEQIYSENLEIMRRVVGQEHRLTLATTGNLALALRTQGKHAQAEALLIGVLEIRRRVMGPENPDTLNTMHNVAEIQAEQGKYAEAEELFRKTLEGRRRAIGQEHPFTLKTLAALGHMYQRQNRYPQAETCAAQALSGRRRALGPEDPRTMESVADLTLAYLSQRKFAESEPLAREAMDITIRKQPGSWERFYAAALLGASLSGQKKYEQAEPLLLEGHRGLETLKDKAGAQERSQMARVREWIIELYQASGRTVNAAEWQQKD
ncbi:MAG: serine/threonine protein kinase [Acidobacteria bacterium]|nr:serine/threonine protein kinase [Acidobacteriota bacterium]